MAGHGVGEQRAGDRRHHPDGGGPAHDLPVDEVLPHVAGCPRRRAGQDRRERRPDGDEGGGAEDPDGGSGDHRPAHAERRRHHAGDDAGDDGQRVAEEAGVQRGAAS